LQGKPLSSSVRLPFEGMAPGMASSFDRKKMSRRNAARKARKARKRNR
jgi:hypothetical protein